MSTSKVDTSGVFHSLPLASAPTRLVLPANRVAFRKTGIEFLSPSAIPLWTEVTIDLRSSPESRAVRGSGVVVDCAGSAPGGYVVSLMMTNLTRQSRQRLSVLADARPA